MHIKTNTSETSEERGFLGPTEVMQRIESLSADDSEALKRFAQRLVRGLRLEADDLYHEVIRRVMDGTRRVRADKRFFYVLEDLMVDVARRERRCLGHSYSQFECKQTSGFKSDDTFGLESARDSRPSPEELAFLFEARAVVRRAFAGWPVDLAILELQLEGREPREIIAKLHLSDQYWEATRKRISRRLASIRKHLS